MGTRLAAAAHWHGIAVECVLISRFKWWCGLKGFKISLKTQKACEVLGQQFTAATGQQVNVTNGNDFLFALLRRGENLFCGMSMVACWCVISDDPPSFLQCCADSTLYYILNMVWIMCDKLLYSMMMLSVNCQDCYCNTILTQHCRCVLIYLDILCALGILYIVLH